MNISKLMKQEFSLIMVQNLPEANKSLRKVRGDLLGSSM